ncbi:flagellar protein FlaG [Shewanella fodinae]|jgi:flagellar protein FlaG|nr:flagellar protein FlaG [Shewanella fodinae]
MSQVLSSVGRRQMNGELSFNADLGLQAAASVAIKKAPQADAVSDSGKSAPAVVNGMIVAEKNATGLQSSDPSTNNSSDEEVSKDSLQQVTDDLTATMSMMRKGLQFRVDEQDGMPVVSVIDVDSGDLIRQIPSQEALDLAEKMSEIAGLLMKTEA